MDDDPAFNIKLIELIQERSCLYDYNRSDYSNRNAQDAAWLDVARIVNKSVADCKERWKNLRGCYTRHLKKNSRPSGSSTKYIKPYYLADHLQFLDSFTKSRPPKGIYKKEDANREESNQETAIDIDEDLENSREYSLSPTPSITDIVEACSRESEKLTLPNHSIKKSRKISLNELNATAMECYQSKQIAKPNKIEDPDFAFLYSLLPDVKEMNSVQKRRFKIGVLKLADGILQENVADDSSPSP